MRDCVFGHGGTAEGVLSPVSREEGPAGKAGPSLF